MNARFLGPNRAVASRVVVDALASLGVLFAVGSCRSAQPHEATERSADATERFDVYSLQQQADALVQSMLSNAELAESTPPSGRDDSRIAVLLCPLHSTNAEQRLAHEAFESALRKSGRFRLRVTSGLDGSLERSAGREHSPTAWTAEAARREGVREGMAVVLWSRSGERGGGDLVWELVRVDTGRVLWTGVSSADGRGRTVDDA